MSNKGWIGVDLDGTLARYDRGKRPLGIGEPIPAMVERVKRWLAEGKYDVRVFTARVASEDPQIRRAVEDWCEKHVGVRLQVTNVKDYEMVELWDDRAVQVRTNTGVPVRHSTRVVMSMLTSAVATAGVATVVEWAVVTQWATVTYHVAVPLILSLGTLAAFWVIF